MVPLTTKPPSVVVGGKEGTTIVMTKEELIEALEKLQYELGIRASDTRLTYKNEANRYFEGFSDGYEVVEMVIAGLLAKAKAAPEER